VDPKVGFVKDNEKIFKMLQSAREEERLQGLKELARCEMDIFLPAVVKALGDESWRVRKEATDLFLALPGADNLAGEVIELLHSEDNAGLRNAAAEILVHLGGQGVPLLLEELSCSDHDVRKFVLDILGVIGDESCVQPMLRALCDPDANVRTAAAENLGKIGGAEAVPALLAAMAHSDLWLRFAILEALGQIGAPVKLASLLEFRDDRMLKKALFDCLGRIGDPDVLPTLAEGLIDDMRNVREAAVVALVRLAGRWPEEVTEHLAGLAGTPSAEAVAGLLDSNDRTVRQAAVNLLGRLRDGRFALLLLELFADEELRASAAAALIAMGRAAVCSLMETWPCADSRTRTYLAYVFGEVECSEALQLLLGGLASAEPELRLASAQALGKLGESAALPSLTTCLGDPSEEVRQVVTEALSRLGVRHRREVVRTLRPLLEHDDPEWRMNVVLILGRLDGEEVEGHLAFAMKDESSLVRRAAVRALEGHKGGGQLQALMLALTDEDDEVRRLAVEALGMTEDPQALGPLELALRDEDIWVRGAAVRALGRLDSATALDLVRGALNDPVGLVGIAALETLAGMGADKAYPSLLEALSHEDEEVVNAALQLLSASGRRDWVPAVFDRLLNHRHWEVRLTFARTLAELEGEGCRPHLESRLMIEGEDLVRHQLRDLLDHLPPAAGVTD
jgi:HEAT repeat protein